MQTFTTDQFTWDGTKGSTDISDLGIRAGDPRPSEFRVQSTKTDHSLAFWFWTENIVDGDLVSSTYVAQHNGQYIIVVLFND